MICNHLSLDKALPRSLLLAFGLLLPWAATATRAQTPDATTAPAAPQPTPDAAETRIARARALAAAHRLASAAGELDSIRTTATDESVRDVARIMLMNVYLEEGDYTRADALLTETFKARSPAQESSVQSYFALAGQTINGARHHIERYREFGINVADKALPPESQSDLERLRSLLELIAKQAREIAGEGAKSTDAVALLEDVAGVRASVARDDEDREHWQQEFTAARQKLAASETRIASISAAPPVRQNQTAAPMTPAAVRSNNPANTTSAKRSNKEQARESANSASVNAPASAAPSSKQPAEASEKRDGASSAVASGTDALPRDVGSLIDRATQKVNPLYPSTAKNIRVTGVVTVYLVVNENGSVEAVQKTSGPQLLRQAAADAAKRWKFQPVMIDGQPVRVTGFISFNFTL